MKSKTLFLCSLVVTLFMGANSFAAIEDGLIGYWPLDGDALDYSVNQNDGTLLAGASFVDNPTGTGQVLQSVLGAANTGHVQVGLPASFHPGNQVVGYIGSGAFWVMSDDLSNRVDASGWQAFLGHAPGLLYVSRKMDSDKIWTMVKRVENGSTNKNSWPQSALDSMTAEGVWYHIAWTFHSHNSGGTGHFRWYINGVLSAEYTNGVQTIGTSKFRIGADYSGQGNNSKIAEVRLYDRTLTENEVYELATTSRLSAGTYPAWWQIPTAGSLELAYALGTPEADYSPVAVGQLKYLAAKARDELDAVLAPVGGAGPEITAMVNAFSSGAPSDHGVANLGQLKYLSSKFFDRFAAIGFNESSEGWPSAITLDPVSAFPWPENPADADRAIANVGQAKFLFSWDISDFTPSTLDSDGDGLPDVWELSFSIDGTGEVDPNSDYDGDGLTAYEEYLSATNPLEYNFSFAGGLTAPQEPSDYYISIISPGEADIINLP